LAPETASTGSETSPRTNDSGSDGQTPTSNLLAWCDENTHVSRHEGNIPHDLIQLPYLLRGRVSAFGSLAVLDATNRIVDLQTGRLLLAEFFPDADNSVVTTLLWVSHLQELIHGELQGVSPRAPQSPASP